MTVPPYLSFKQPTKVCPTQKDIQSPEFWDSDSGHCVAFLNDSQLHRIHINIFLIESNYSEWEKVYGHCFVNLLTFVSLLDMTLARKELCIAHMDKIENYDKLLNIFIN